MQNTNQIINKRNTNVFSCLLRLGKIIAKNIYLIMDHRVREYHHSTGDILLQLFNRICYNV